MKIENYALLILAILYVSCNIYLAASPLVACFKWLKLLELILFCLYIIKTKPSVSRSLWCLSFAIFYSSLIAIAQFFLQHSIGGIFWFFGERTFDVTTLGIARISIQPSAISHQISEMLRPYATFPHPNVLGGFLAVTLPLIITSPNFSLSFRPTSRNPFLKIFGSLIKSEMTHNWFSIFRTLTIILGIIALILTFSRSAWALGIFFILILLIKSIYFTKKIKFKFIIMSLVGLVTLVGLIVSALPYFQTLTPNNESVYVRNELNSAAISMWWSSSLNTSLTSFFLPRLFGVGLGNYLVELPKYYPHRDIFFLQPVHNIYLLVLSETGLIGLGITIYLLFYLFKTALHKRQFSIMHYALCIMLFIGLVDHYPITLQQGQLLLTLLIALSVL